MTISPSGGENKKSSTPHPAWIWTPDPKSTKKKSMDLCPIFCERPGNTNSSAIIERLLLEILPILVCLLGIIFSFSKASVKYLNSCFRSSFSKIRPPNWKQRWQKQHECVHSYKRCIYLAPLCGISKSVSDYMWLLLVFPRSKFIQIGIVNFCGICHDAFHAAELWNPRDPGSPNLRMVSWNPNTFRFGDDYTPLAHHLTFGEPGSLGKWLVDDKCLDSFSEVSNVLLHQNPGRPKVFIRNAKTWIHPYGCFQK